MGLGNPGFARCNWHGYDAGSGVAPLCTLKHDIPFGNEFDPMKTYEGKRAFDGLIVTVDGQILPEHYEVERFTTWGFEWTYEGESPQQLALAILYDHLGDRTRAIGLSGRFMKKIVADLDNDWVLTSADIDRAIAAIEAA